MIPYLLAVFAAYRIARLFTMEEGPGVPYGSEEDRKHGIFDRIRSHIDPTGEQKTLLARGINCPLCVGVYVAFGMALLLRVDTWQMFLLAWFGVAGAQTLLHLWGEQWNG